MVIWIYWVYRPCPYLLRRNFQKKHRRQLIQSTPPPRPLPLPLSAFLTEYTDAHEPSPSCMISKVSWIRKIIMEFTWLVEIEGFTNGHPIHSVAAYSEKKELLKHSKFLLARSLILFVWFRLTHPTPGIEPGGRMRCAISSMSSVSETHADKSHNLTVSYYREFWYR